MASVNISRKRIGPSSRHPNLLLDRLEPRILLSEATSSSVISDLWHDVKRSPFLPALLTHALGAHGETFSGASTLMCDAIDSFQGSLPDGVDANADITLSLGISAECSLGFPGASVEAASLSTGYNLTYSLATQFYTLSRAIQLSLPLIDVQAEYFASFESILDLSPADSITFGVTAAVSGGIEAKTQIGQLFQAGASASMEGNLSITAETTISVSEFLTDYVHQDTLAEGLADVFIPYYGDTWWENLLVGAASFAPILPLNLLLDLTRTDTPLGILAHSGDVRVSIRAGADIAAGAWVGLGGEVPVTLGVNVGLSLTAGVAVSAGVGVTLWSTTFHGWAPQRPDTTPPQVLSYYMSSASSNSIHVLFNTDLRSWTICDATVSVAGSMSGFHPASISYASAERAIVVQPYTGFVAGETISVTIGTDILSSGGESLASPAVLEMTAGEPTDAPMSVLLRDVMVTSEGAVAPGSPVRIAGRVEYSSGHSVRSGTVTIDTGDNVYTAAIYEGAFTQTISAPHTTSSIRITAVDGKYELEDSVTRTLGVILPGPGDNYTVDTTAVLYYIEDRGDEAPPAWLSKDTFSDNDEFYGAFVYLRNVYTGLRVQWQYYKPDGSALGSPIYVDVDPPGTGDWEYWDWYYVYDGGYPINANRPALEAGTYSVAIWIDDGDGYERIGTEHFTWLFEFTEHRMATGVSPDEPYDPINVGNSFSQNEPIVYAWCNLDFVSRDLSLQWEFWNPEGDIVVAPVSTQYAIPDPAAEGHVQWDYYRAWCGIRIAGMPWQELTGRWEVDVYLTDQGTGVRERLYTDYFMLVEAMDAPPYARASLHGNQVRPSEDIVVEVTAGDNNRLSQSTLFWDDGTLHQYVVTDNAPLVRHPWSVYDEVNIGGFSAGSRVEYWVTAEDASGNWFECPHQVIVVPEEQVLAPTSPACPSVVAPLVEIECSSGTSESNIGSAVEYQFDWGDGGLSLWGSSNVLHSWAYEGSYSLRVRARSAANWQCVSTWSDPLVVTVLPLRPPQEFSSTIDPQGRVVLSWVDPENAYDVIVERKVAGESEWARLASVSIGEERYEDDGLSPLKTYMYRVRAHNELVESAASQVRVVSAPDGPPSCPGDAKAVAVSVARIEVHWADMSANESGFLVERCEAGQEGWAMVGVAGEDTPVLIDDGVAPGHVYSYRVSAFNALGVSEPCLAAECGTPWFEATDACLMGMAGSVCAWADYDGDGDLDVLLSGGIPADTTVLYDNNQGKFADSGLSFAGAHSPGAGHGNATWGDYDADGDLDLLLYNHVYRNDGGNFEDVQGALAGAGVGAWGDCDNDGDLDLLLMGNGYGARIFRNESGRFVDSGALVEGIWFGAVSWVDYDADGDLDIFVSGQRWNPEGDDPEICALLLNEGGVFTSTCIAQDVIPLTQCDISWADYDLDGDPDLLIGGRSGLQYLCNVYRNEGTSLVQVDCQLSGGYYGSVAWGDYDNDGDFDIMCSGGTGVPGQTPERMLAVFQNTCGTFEELDTDFEGLIWGQSAWGDYDGDGDLDVLATGYDTARVPMSVVYRNNAADANTIPCAPDMLCATEEGTRITLTWGSGSDMETPATGLTYSIYVGSAPGRCDVVSGMADMSTGVRMTPGSGSSGYSLSRSVTGLRPGVEYYWSVQCVDSNFTSSPWAAEQSFVIETPSVPQGVTAEVEPTGVVRLTWMDTSCNTEGLRVDRSEDPSGSWSTVAQVPGDVNGFMDSGLELNHTYWYRVTAFNDVAESEPSEAVEVTVCYFSEWSAGLQGLEYSRMACADYDKDGDLDVIVCGSTESEERITTLLRNDDGVLADSGACLPGVRQGMLSWADYDADGDLDILVGGDTGVRFITKVLVNEEGMFLDSGVPLPGLVSGTSAWADYDGDGAVDLLIAGRDGWDSVTQIYNNVNGSLVLTEIALPNLGYSCAQWGDFDMDGDQDVLLCGRTHSGEQTTRLYVNRGGVFEDAGLLMPGVSPGAADLVDVDCDGDLDIVVVGNGCVAAFRNEGGEFIEYDAGIRAIADATTAYGDYDNDGDADLLIAGLIGNPVCRVYRNEGGVFVDSNTALPGVYRGDVAWADLDNDGALDIVVTGTGEGGRPVLCTYHNELNVVNEPPEAPSHVEARWSGDEIQVAWDAGVDRNTASECLTYELRVGTAPGAGNIMPGAADEATGMRWLPGQGAIGSGLTWTLSNVDVERAYYIQVQAIDSGYAGSCWSDPIHVVTAPPRVPDGLAASVELPTCINLRWCDVSQNEEGFAIERRIGDVSPWGEIGRAGSDVTSYVDDQCTPGTSYWYRVRSYNDCGTSTATAPLEVSTWPVLPESPIALTAEAVSSSEVAIEWSYEGGTLEGFIVERRADESGSWAQIAELGALQRSLVDSELIAFSMYSYRVRAFNGLGESLPSEEACARTMLFSQVPVGVPACVHGSFAPGDYDLDGDLDIAVSGDVSDGEWAGIIGNGLDGWNMVEQSIAAVRAGASTSWCDYDRDGDLDLFISGGDDSGATACLYRNQGAVLIDAGVDVEGVLDSDVAWGDYDNDGDMDIVVAGRGAEGPVARIYRNDGGYFEEVWCDLPGISRGTVDWVDVDGDSDLDLFLCGDTGGGYLAKLFLNKDSGFVDSGAFLPGVADASSSWGDYDNDGRMDLLLAGCDPEGRPRCWVYEYRSGRFVDSGSLLEGASRGLVSFGDFDCDGDLDAFVAGEGALGPICVVYMSDDGEFVRADDELAGWTYGAAAVGDYDGDGDIDVLFSGVGGDGLSTVLFRNDSEGAPCCLSAPTGLTASPDDGSVLLAWTRSMEDGAGVSGVTYNLRVGTAPGGYDVLSPMAECGTGIRLVPGVGNTGSGNAWRVDGLIAGRRYYWSVQAVGPSFRGSEWAGEAEFVAEGPSCVLDAGNHHLLPDTAGQVLELRLTGGGVIRWADVKIQIGDGGPELSQMGMPEGEDGPDITSVEFLGGVFPEGGTSRMDRVILPQFVYSSVRIEDGASTAEGVLVRLTVDTRGFELGAGPWEIRVASTVRGGTTFGGSGVGIVDGWIDLRSPSDVVDRAVYYNNSAFDGMDAGVGSGDDRAIAIDKRALLPGESASVENYTNYGNGINGVMVDIWGLWEPAELGVNDLGFAVGNTSDPSAWGPAPVPEMVSVREGAGVSGSDRIVIVWADGEIRNEWLRVEVKATDKTGLSKADVFYFGNCVGEAGNCSEDAVVDMADLLLVRANAGMVAAVDCPFDFNRDGVVDVSDEAIAEAASKSLPESLKLISVPGPALPNPLPRVLGTVRNCGQVTPGRLDSVAVVFSENVCASLCGSELALHDDSRGSWVALEGADFHYDSGTNTAWWILLGVAIPAGYYTAALPAPGIADVGGGLLDGNGDGTGGDDWVSAPILVAPYGDANLDGRVGIADLSALADNYGVESGTTWAMGDFNGDGKVGIADLAALADHYGEDVRPAGGEPGGGVTQADQLAPPAQLDTDRLATESQPSQVHEIIRTLSPSASFEMDASRIAVDPAPAVPVAWLTTNPSEGAEEVVDLLAGPDLAVIPALL